MKLVERHTIKQNHENYKEIDEICFKAKNLYNRANYLVRQHFIKINNEKQGLITNYINDELCKNIEGSYVNFNKIDRIMIDTNDKDYRDLPAKVSKQIIIKLDKNWKSFFVSIKDWVKHPSKYTSKPSLVKYKHKTKGRFLTTYERGAISTNFLKEGVIKLSNTNIKIPFMNQKKATKLNQVRLVPKNNHTYVLEIVYEVNEEKQKNTGIKASIDLGMNNLMAITFNLRNQRPFLINGRSLKSVNQYYNKIKAKLQSQLPKDQYNSKQIEKLTTKRNNKINHFIHVVTHGLTKLFNEMNVDRVIIGYNKKWKDEIELGKITNQNFVSIPFLNIINKLKYKLKLIGVELITREESYTSKTSFLDLEPISKHEKYLGKRVKRGLFKSNNGTRINADVNGSYNILRKEFPDEFSNGIEGFAVNPLRLNLINKF